MSAPQQLHDDAVGVDVSSAPAPAVGATPATEGGAAPAKQSVRQWGTKKMLYTLRTINLINALVMILTGILVCLVGLMQVTFTSVTVSAYIVFFGLMMTCLECNLGNIAPRFRGNFGFMFSFTGRTVFLIFCGTMLLALDMWLGWLVGIITILNGMFNGYVLCVHPAFRTGEIGRTNDPYGGYSGGETEMLGYLKKNPALAERAASAAATFAAKNPEKVLQLAAAANASQAGAGAGAPPAA